MQTSSGLPRALAALLAAYSIALAGCNSAADTTGPPTPEPTILALSGSLSPGLLPLPAGHINGVALDVNDNMVAVGNANPDDPLTPVREGPSVAVRWTSMSEVAVLPPLPGATNCGASRINEHGTTVGYCDVAGIGHAVLWTPKGEVQDLGIGGGFINNSGDMAYVSGGRIYVRDKHGTVEDRGSGTATSLYGLNNRGDIVGETYVGPRAAEVFVLRKNGTREVIPNSDAGNFSMTPRAGINDAGQVAGNFVRRGNCPGRPVPSYCTGAWRWSAADGYLEFEHTQNDVQIGDINNDGLIGGGVMEYDVAPPRPAIVWDWNGNRIYVNRMGRWAYIYGLNGGGLPVGEVVEDVPSNPSLKYLLPVVW